jgi:uncharacterized protein YjbI with pentapeptide repeats
MSFNSTNTYENNNFSDINEENSIWDGVSFIACKITDSRIFDSTFRKCSFEDCEFENVDLSLCRFEETSFTDCYFRNCKLMGIDWKLAYNGIGLTLKGDKCNFSYSMFDEINISHSQFTDCEFKDVDFTLTGMQECKFRDSDFEKAKIVKADLTKSDFIGSYHLIFNPAECKTKDIKIDTPTAKNILSVLSIEVVD